MQNTSRLEDALSHITGYAEFYNISSGVHEFLTGDLFEALWPIAIQWRGNRAAGMAADLLVVLQPAPNQSLEQLLSDIHASELDASDRSVPFYLVAEFGKQTVLGACAEFLDQLSEEQEQSRVAAIRYWASGPASELCNHLHDWAAREMYGVPEDPWLERGA